MKKLSIQISKAQLTGYDIRLQEDGLPRVTAYIALYTEEGKHVTDYNISTHGWNDDKFELPIKMIEPIQKICAALEHVIVEQMREGQLALGTAVEPSLV